MLFAGLLAHWETKGPGQIPAKRVHMFRSVQRHAERSGIPFKVPPAHPFKPVPPLRLCIALGATADVVGTMFDLIWRDGRDIGNPDVFADLCRQLGVDDPDALVEESRAADTLAANTDEAIAAGVFGVPTFRIGDDLFWGNDSTETLLDYLDDPEMFTRGEYPRLATLPSGLA